MHLALQKAETIIRCCVAPGFAQPSDPRDVFLVFSIRLSRYSNFRGLHDPVRRFCFPQGSQVGTDSAGWFVRHCASWDESVNA